jgi:hypothetical protein
LTIHVDVAGDVSISDWQFWENNLSTRGKVLENGKVPHGPVMGCHVAPQYWHLVCCLKLVWGPWGSNPGPPFGSARWWSVGYHQPTHCSLFNICRAMYLSLFYMVVGVGVRAGA